MPDFSAVYAHDKSKAEDGTWADIGADIKVKVRAFDSAHTRALRKSLEEPYKALTRVGKEIPEEAQNDINTKLVAYSSLIDWNLEERSGETDTNGKDILRPIPFTPETAEKLFQQEPEFLKDVIAVLISRETFKKTERLADSKNS